MRPRWDDLHELVGEAVHEGTLFDVYVLATSEEDWQRLLDLVRAKGWPFSYFESKSSITEMPADVSDVFKLWTSDSMASLALALAPDVHAHCHFFSKDEIELSLDPSEIRGQPQLDVVCDFVEAVGHTLRKDVLLCPENAPHSRFMRFDSKTDEIFVEAH